ncbi:DUF1129 domain-containing protein [Hutsoniella sourekii]
MTNKKNPQTTEEIQEDITIASEIISDDVSHEAGMDPSSSQTSHELVPGIDYYTFEELTKRNQQFIINVDKQLVDHLEYSDRSAIHQEMVETLLEGQKNSQTARQIYGTPSEVAQGIIGRDTEAEEEDATPSPEWQIFMDGSLFLGSIFTFLTGLSMVNSPEKATYLGLTTMILNYLVAGFAMLAVVKVMPNPEAPKGERGYIRYFIVSILAMLAWFMVVSMSAVYIPNSINPILPGVYYMVIGGITFALRYWLRNHFKIKGGMF